MEAHVRLDEADRLRALRDLEILDTIPEAVYDRIVRLAAEVCCVPIALFSLVDEERQWFKARVGLEACQTSRDVSFCAHAVADDDVLVVTDAHEDERFCDNALVRSSPWIRAYTGVPVHGRGALPLGTLCVIDTEPHALTSAQRRILEELAREIEAHLELRATIRDLRVVAAERTVLSSMVAHDARNLMMTMMHWIETGQAEPAGEGPALDHIADSVSRLHRMCQNFVEVNGSDSYGIPVAAENIQLRSWFEQFLARERPRAVREGLRLEGLVDAGTDSVHADLALLERIVLNLVDNALRATPRGGSVFVRIEGGQGAPVSVVVDDEGDGVPPDLAEHIFEPYFSVRHTTKRGTGLGLAFCRLAAHAMGGSVRCEQRAGGGARFVLTLA